MSIAAIAAPVHARLPPAPPALAVGQLELANDFIALVTAPGVPWLANAIALGPGPTVVWDPVVARVEPGPALAARGSAILRALGVARPAAVAGALSGEATQPQRAAVAALFAALGSGDVAARRRAALALLGRGPGLTPEGDDLLAGACVTAAAAGDPVAPAPGVRDADDAAVVDAARARGGGGCAEARPRAAGPRRRALAWRPGRARRASAPRAAARSRSASARPPVVLGARAARSVPPPAARHFVS